LFAAAFFVWSGTIAQLRHTFLFSAVSATKDCIVLFNPVADNMRATMRTSRCEGLDRTLEAVKGVILAIQYHLERLVVVVAAGFADWHGCLSNEI
jgi:hypothetical protein